MKISDFSTEELQKEMDRRKIKKSIPQKLSEDEIEKNLNSLVEMAESMVQEKMKNGYSDEDNPQYCFEAIMQAVYGEKIWDWWNNAAR